MTKILLACALGILVFQACHHRSEEQFTGPILLSSAEQKASCVYLTKDEKNIPVVSWCETDAAEKKYFYLSYFDTSAGTFSSAVPIPIAQNANIHEEGMPKIAIKGDGTLVALYETTVPTKENPWAGSIRYIQSFDKGKTWSSPGYVHAGTTAGKERSFAAMTRLSNGEIGVCWLDTTIDPKRAGRPVKFAATAGNDGFRHEVLVDSSACECCRTSISSDTQGHIAVVYRDITGNNIRDISVSRSADNGQSFSTPVLFSNDGWQISGCPHNGPSVANTVDTTYATWFTGGTQSGVYYGELDSSNQIIRRERISADSRNIQLALLANGAKVLAYNQTVPDGDLFYSKIIVRKINGKQMKEKNITSSKAQATYPVINSFGSDKIIVAWADQEKIYYTVIDQEL